MTAGKKLTQNEVLERFKKVHGDKYDYSKVVFIDIKTKVKIKCKKHGYFWQVPINHYRGSHCRDCTTEKNAKNLRGTTEEFLRKAKERHGDEFGYSRTKYINSSTKVEIECQKHGLVTVYPNDHIRGGKCPKCAPNRKKTQDKFIKEATRIHGNKYDYIKVKYVSSHLKVSIICNEHGEFEQTPSTHLQGHGCWDCGVISRGKKQRKTTEQFVLESINVHDNKYDYSLVQYERDDKKVQIICPIHDEFPQTPSDHLQGHGCWDCGNESRTKKNTKPAEYFLNNAIKIHGDYYDYSKVKYKNITEKIVISCKKHGDFFISPRKHLFGQGCKDCGIERTSEKQRKSTEQFIKESKEVHGDTYDYSDVKYITSSDPVLIRCKIHQLFPQRPYEHLSSRGCRLCGIIYRSETTRKDPKLFLSQIKKIHGDTYNFEKVNYINEKHKVTIICKKHGEFLARPASLLKGIGCWECGIAKRSESLRKSSEQFINEANIIHKYTYLYEKVVYILSSQHVVITCKIHGDFPQNPSNHLAGAGCSRCKFKSEGRIAIILNEFGIVHRQYRIENRRFDYYLPDYNLLIERDGEQHYIGNWYKKNQQESLIEQRENDTYKTNLAKSSGFKISRIPFWLNHEEEYIEVKNILEDNPSYPDVPDLNQFETHPKPQPNLN